MPFEPNDRNNRFEPKKDEAKVSFCHLSLFLMLFLQKKVRILGGNKIKRYLCTRNYKRYGTVAQLNRASDYGSEGLGFESLQRHKVSEGWILPILTYFVVYAMLSCGKKQ